MAKFIPVYTLDVKGVTDLYDANQTLVSKPRLHTIYVAKDDNADIGTKLYAGKDGIFYPDDLAEKIASYVVKKTTTKKTTTKKTTTKKSEPQPEKATTEKATTEKVG